MLLVSTSYSRISSLHRFKVAWPRHPRARALERHRRRVHRGLPAHRAERLEVRERRAHGRRRPVPERRGRHGRGHPHDCWGRGRAASRDDDYFDDDDYYYDDDYYDEYESDYEERMDFFKYVLAMPVTS